ncbi:MAG: PRC-barrel domain-containing protein [Chloroflexi bacterium]|nr:PRC-barrel domain-containing protein [Chloroflexota bacterium]
MKTKVKGKAAKSRDVEVHTNRPIHSKDGKELGKIVEVVYMPDRSKIRFAVIDFGEPYSGEKKLFAVSWDAIEFDRTGFGVLDFDVDPDILAKAMPLDEENAEEVKAQKRLKDVSLLFLQRTKPLE